MKIKFDETDIVFFKKHKEFNSFNFLKEIKPLMVVEIDDSLADELRDICLELEVSLLGKNYSTTVESSIATNLADKLFYY